MTTEPDSPAATVVIGDPRPSGDDGPAGDQRPSGTEGLAGDPRPGGAETFEQLPDDAKPTTKGKGKGDTGAT